VLSTRQLKFTVHTSKTYEPCVSEPLLEGRGPTIIELSKRQTHQNQPGAQIVPGVQNSVRGKLWSVPR
jgi:hypothetical protein